MTQRVREKKGVRISHELQHEVSILAAKKGITKNAALEALLKIGLEVHDLIESGLIVPKAG